MINITITNNDTIDLFVIANDKGAPGSPVVYNSRLNAHATSGLVSVQEDGNGNFLISTTVTDPNDATHIDTKDHTGSSGDDISVALP
jgi:hypothetical protein